MNQPPKNATRWKDITKNPYPFVYVDLEKDMREMVEAEGLNLFDATLKLSPKKPFYLERITTTQHWLSKHLQPADVRLYQSFQSISDLDLSLMLFVERYNPSGAYIEFDYEYLGSHPRAELQFLLQYGTAQMKDAYRLIALFLGEDDLTHFPKEALDVPSLETDINLIGKQLAVELSEKISAALAPFYTRLFARIEEAKRQIDINDQSIH